MSAKLILMCGTLAIAAQLAAAQPDVHVEKPILQGPRPLEPQTQTAAVKGYLQAWRTLNSAMDQNRPELLDRDFAGIAHDKITLAIQQQLAAGLHTRYLDKAHDIQIKFYSPEGLSIELTDTVDYDVDVLDHDKVLTTQHAHERYVVVMTPAEVSWRVRVFQAQPAD